MISDDKSNIILLLIIVLILAWGIYNTVRQKRSLKERYNKDVYYWIESIKGTLTNELKNINDKLRRIENKKGNGNEDKNNDSK